MRKVELRNFSLTFPGFIINIALTLSNDDSVNLCNTPINIWLLVYEGIIFLYVFKCLLNIVLIKRMTNHKLLLKIK